MSVEQHEPLTCGSIPSGGTTGRALSMGANARPTAVPGCALCTTSGGSSLGRSVRHQLGSCRGSLSGKGGKPMSIGTAPSPSTAPTSDRAGSGPVASSVPGTVCSPLRGSLGAPTASDTSYWWVRSLTDWNWTISAGSEVACALSTWNLSRPRSTSYEGTASPPDMLGRLSASEGIRSKVPTHSSVLTLGWDGASAGSACGSTATRGIAAQASRGAS
jgi:hypothetical protein